MTCASSNVSSGADSSAAVTVFEFTPDRGTIAIDVVEAVSSAADTDPRTLEPRLHDAIDPDALTRCIRSGGTGTRVSFELGAYRVTVESAGRIVVEEA